MNIKTSKKLSLLIIFSLTAACSSSGGSRMGGQLSPGSQGTTTSATAGGGQSMPGSQLMGRQGAAKKVATSTNVNKLPTVPKNNANMRKIVLKAPARPIAPTTITRQPTRVQTGSTVGVTTSKPVMTKPMPVVSRTVPRTAAPRAVVAPRKPVVTQPYRAPVVKQQPVRVAAKPKPQSTVRRLTLNGSTNFKSGSSRLTNEGQTKLLGLALSLQEGNTRITRLLIEGHTDSVGDAAMNQVLSLKRANAVAEYLAKQGGFARSSMRTLGLGESKPVASNKTRKGRAQNRRVEITATGTRQINR
jgi:OOP family OmpA-OmpF porin